jgi:streptomycin 6-kinase
MSDLAQFKQTTLNLFGEKGQQWLDHLPELLASLEQRWSIRIQPPFPDLTYNYVAPAISADGTQVVLKVWVDNPELRSEMAALAHFNGRGYARLLESAPDLGAMLIERLVPGVPLAEIEDDDEATRIAARLMRETWVPAPDNVDGVFPTIEKWSRGMQRLRKEFDGGTGPFPSKMVEKAERLFVDLQASAAPPVLLHGDLHHWNILSAQREPWLVLDPKGVIGEPAFEPAQIFLNRWPKDQGHSAIKAQAERRLAIFSEVLDMDPKRIMAWTFAKSVLSAWWTYEERQMVEPDFMEFTSVMDEMSL